MKPERKIRRMTVTESEMVECYGKRPVKDGVDQCPRRAECPWGEMCLSRSREKLDADHYHIANVSVGFMLYDPNAEDDGTPRIYADETAEREAMAEKEVLTRADADASDDEEEKDVELEEITIPGAEYLFYFCVFWAVVGQLFGEGNGTPLQYSCL